MLTIESPPEKGIDDVRSVYISREDGEPYHQFHRSSVIWEGMIIARGLDSEDTKASGEYCSALSCPALRLEETGKAVRRLPKNAPLNMLTWMRFIIPRMKG
jgi:hypothetical protein